ncbi:MAG: hypothetical protein H7Z40_12680 [Phycisphaerae bacterium]|nr:hypothetical protein [Gemmatimonadaceae bacterium]
MHDLIVAARSARNFAVACCIAGCSTSNSATTEPLLPGNSNSPSPYRNAAFIVDVSTVRRTVKISAPVATLGTKPLVAGLQSSAAHLSLLGTDVIDVSVSNYVAGAIGVVVPGKILVTFDLTLHNRLSGIRLVTPTFPLPPAGVTGVQAFPFEVSVITTSGGVGTVGNEILVTSPRFGSVIASNHWDGAPHSFFNDTDCTTGSNDCFRYEPFGMIGPLGASQSRQVGFLVDPTVGDLRVRLIVAANVQAVAVP